MRIREHVTGNRWRVARASRFGRVAGPLAADGAHGVTRPAHAIENRKSKIENGFTMVEIAICLAIIGIALVAIIGVLPIGINVQKNNRQDTLIDQDAGVLMESVRNGARAVDELTNYVMAITNYWTYYPALNARPQTGVNGYTPTGAFVYGNSVPLMALTNGANIIGLLSTPEYTDKNGIPIPSLADGGYSNHVVAWVRCISGPAFEKPPQTNADIISGSFSYKVICDNAPAQAAMSVATPPLWVKNSYNPGDYVSYLINGQITYWRATASTSPLDQPTQSSLWVQDSYATQCAANLHSLRLTFLWPLLPNGNTGNGRHTFATSVAGQVVASPLDSSLIPASVLYFFEPQIFTAVP